MRKLFVLFAVALMTGAVLTGCSKEDETRVNIGVLKGPTGIGAVDLMAKADGNPDSSYQFSLTPEVTDIVARLTNGDLDIGALPTNTAANLYNKTNGDVEIIAINCESVLYILENGNAISSIADLKGHTIYVNGQGANPEYVINFCLRKNNLEPGRDVDVQFRDAGEISAMMISGEAELCMLPVPAVTTIMQKNADVRKALDMAVEYDKAAEDGSALTMGCLVARKDFIEKHPEAVERFIEKYRESIAYVLDNIDEAAELVAKYEITGSAAIAKAAIPDCGIVCLTGDEIRPALEGYLKVLYEASPASIGGALPEADFYYVK